MKLIAEENATWSVEDMWSSYAMSIGGLLAPDQSAPVYFVEHTTPYHMETPFVDVRDLLLTLPAFSVATFNAIFTFWRGWECFENPTTMTPLRPDDETFRMTCTASVGVQFENGSKGILVKPTQMLVSPGSKDKMCAVKLAAYGTRMFINRRCVPLPPDINEKDLDFMSYVSVAALMDLAHLLSSPRHYVLCAERVRPPTKPHTPRADYIDRLYVVDPEELVRKYRSRQNLGGSHLPPRPHMRAGHDRRLTSARYGEPRIVRVRPTFVGDREWVNADGVKYRLIRRAGAAEDQA